MLQLMYVSDAVELFTDDDLDSLLETSRRNNRASQVTGMLVYHQGSFIQILEGEKSAVETVFEKICADPRHQNINLIEAAQTGHRAFAAWDMAFRKPSMEDLNNHPLFKDILQNKLQDRVRPSKLAQAFVDLLTDMSL